jgi:hypothetical protein
MKFEKTQVMNFEGAFRGLRNPLESWAKSDSQFGIAELEYCDYDYEIAADYIDANEKYDFDEEYNKWDEANEKYAEWLRENGVLNCNCDHNAVEYAFLGPKDLNLAQRMIKAGTSDRKFLRQIMVSVDITAPLYWWKEFDTYKVGTVANSTSTMHKLASTPITFDCFEMDDFENLRVYDNEPYNTDTFITDIWDDIIGYCETLRLRYNETKDKKYWKELIRILPEAWLQTRTVTLNYEVLRNIYFQRRYHKLTEWHQFCEWIESLPYGKELITYEG